MSNACFLRVTFILNNFLSTNSVIGVFIAGLERRVGNLSIFEGADSESGVAEKKSIKINYRLPTF